MFDWKKLVSIIRFFGKIEVDRRIKRCFVGVDKVYIKKFVRILNFISRSIKKG